MAGPGQGMAQGADDPSTDEPGIAEPDLGLGRMHVHIDQFVRQVEEEGGGRMPVAGEEKSA